MDDGLDMVRMETSRIEYQRGQRPHEKLSRLNKIVLRGYFQALKLKTNYH